MPPRRREKKGSKTRARSSGGKPGPQSLTVHHEQRAVRLAVLAPRSPKRAARGRVLDGVLQQVLEDLHEALAVHEHAAAARRHRSLSAPSRGAGRERSRSDATASRDHGAERSGHGRRLAAGLP